MTHVYPHQGRYVFRIKDASKLNYSYSSLGNNSPLYPSLVSRVIRWNIKFGIFTNCTEAVITELAPITTNFSLYGCHNATVSVIPAGVGAMRPDSFYKCKRIKEVTFLGRPSSWDNRCFRSSYVNLVRVPWSEGDVDGFPWSSSITVIYNYTE